MHNIRIGINGFGRIGRMIFRACLERCDLEVVGINDILSIEQVIYLLKYDTVHHTLKYNIMSEDNNLIINGHKIRVTQIQDPANLRWNEINVDYVVESTGKFLTYDLAKKHLNAGASKVVLSAPAEDNTPMFVSGVNLDKYIGQRIISNASCTTNCLAPIAYILHKHFGIQEGLMTTVHPVTGSQKVVDSYSKRDYRAGRSGLANIIPYHTGAAKSIGKIIPELEGKLTGICFRVPTLDVSVIDFSVKLKQNTCYEEICKVIKDASETSMSDIIGYEDEEMVSSDFLDQTKTSYFDATSGVSVSDSFFKIIAWYDNEIGYSNKLLDLIKYTYTYDQKIVLNNELIRNKNYHLNMEPIE